MGNSKWNNPKQNGNDINIQKMMLAKHSLQKGFVYVAILIMGLFHNICIAQTSAHVDSSQYSTMIKQIQMNDMVEFQGVFHNHKNETVSYAYIMTLNKKGTSGNSHQQQIGTFSAKYNEKVILSISKLNFIKGDSCFVNLTIKDNDRILSNISLVYP